MEPDLALANLREALLRYRAARAEYFALCETEQHHFVSPSVLDYLRDQIVNHAVDATEYAALLDEGITDNSRLPNAWRQ